MKSILAAIIMALFFAPTSGQESKIDKVNKESKDKILFSDGRITDTHKRDFVRLLKKLPVKGEFYTEESVSKAAPFLPVLFALTEDDIRGLDIYPFLAMSRGIYERKFYRNYAKARFSEIRHPVLKLSWAVMLFDGADGSIEIVSFLKKALDSESQSKLVSQMTGPKFEDFKRRVQLHP